MGRRGAPSQLLRQIALRGIIFFSTGLRILFFSSGISLDPVKNNKEITVEGLKNHLIRSENSLEAISLEVESTVFSFLWMQLYTARICRRS